MYVMQAVQVEIISQRSRRRFRAGGPSDPCKVSLEGYGEVVMKDKNYDGLDVARRIRAAGRPIYIAEDDGAAPSIPCDGLLVRQCGGLMESRAIACGGTAFIIHLVITSKLPTFAISAFGLEPPWKNEYLNWLEDPLQIDGASRSYRFGIKGVPDFEREHVINHYADVRHIFPSGHSVKGFLLCFGFDPIPRSDFRCAASRVWRQDEPGHCGNHALWHGC